MDAMIPKTLGEYRDFCAAIDGEDSPAVKFFDEKIQREGREAKVLADETQMLMLIGSLLKGSAG
jgi:hypothetical protein